MAAARRAVARAFARAGAAVMLSARTVNELEETAALIAADGGRAAVVPADVTDRGTMEAVLGETEARLGPVSVLVNNAGAGRGGAGPYEALAWEAITRTVAVNLLGAMLCTRLVLPGMLERGAGRIINVASGAGLVGMSYLNAYGVAKTGLIRFSENLALELRGRGVAVFAITPGVVRTEATEGIWRLRHEPEPPGWLGKMEVAPHENFADEAAWQPPKRAAALCQFLASGQAHRLSGRFFSAYADEAEMMAHAEEVEAGMLHTLRLPTLHGLERPTTQEDIAAARTRTTEAT